MKYTSAISDKKRMMLGSVAMFGWLASIGGLIFYMVSGAEGLGTVVLSVIFLFNCLSVLFVLIGLIEIISQRIRKRTRTISKGNLIFGFRFAVFGSLAGFVCSGAAVLIDFIWLYEGGACFAAQCVMADASLVGFAFGLPILRSFKLEKE